MQLTDGERFILRMLAEINQHLKIRDGIDGAFVGSALSSGNTWALDVKYHVEGEGNKYPPVVDEVRDILGMWEVIEQSYEKLSDSDKKRIDTEMEGFNLSLRFMGFDADNEQDQIRIADFLIDQFGEFELFQGRKIEYRLPGALDHYRKMLPIFTDICGANGGGVQVFTEQQIIDVLRARRSDDGLKLVPKPS